MAFGFGSYPQDWLRKHWILVFAIGLSGVGFFDLFHFYFFQDRALYGSMYSWQFYPVVNSMFYGLRDHVYPFFTFNYSGGMDTLAESQSSVGHPAKILIAALSSNPASIDTIFIVVHTLISAIGSYLYFSSKLRSREIALFVATTYASCLSLYLNFCHPMFIAAMAYHPWILIFQDRLLKRWTFASWTGLTLSIVLMMLCGHFNMQFLVLVSMIFHLAIVYYSSDIRPTKQVLLILAAIVFGFWFSSFQLLPTFDLMGETVRAKVGGIDKMLVSSVSLFQMLAYICPAIVSMALKVTPHFMDFWTAPSIAEGVHYVGIIPLALALMAFVHRPLEIEIKVAVSVLAFMIARSLGVFSITNILLDQLPVFGQFRIPTRNLHIVDFLICMLAGYGLIHLKANVGALDRVLKALFAVSVSIVAVFVAVTLLSSWRENKPVDHYVSFGELVFLLLPAIAAAGARIILNYFAIRSWNAVLASLLALTTLEMALQRHASPVQWTTPSLATLRENGRVIDEKCGIAQIQNAWMHMDFGEVSHLSFWPYFNVPIYPFAKMSKGESYMAGRDWHEAGEVINGSRCGLTYFYASSTLTPKTRELAHPLLMDASEDSIARIAHQYGFDGVGRWQSLFVSARKFAAQVDLDKLSFSSVGDPPASRDPLPVASVAGDASAGRFSSLTPHFFAYIDRFGLKAWLPQKTIHLTADETTLPFGPFGYFIFQNLQGETVMYSGRSAVFQIEGKPSSLLKVFYVPVVFLLGLGLSLAALPCFLAMGFILRRRQFNLDSHSTGEENASSRMKEFEARFTRLVHALNSPKLENILAFVFFTSVCGGFVWNLYRGVPSIETMAVAYCVLISVLACFYYVMVQISEVNRGSIRSTLYFMGINSSFGLSLWISLVIAKS